MTKYDPPELDADAPAIPRAPRTSTPPAAKVTYEAGMIIFSVAIVTGSSADLFVGRLTEPSYLTIMLALITAWFARAKAQGGLEAKDVIEMMKHR